MELQNVIELAEKLAIQEISSKDSRVVEAQKLIAEMMKTEEGRDALAEIVTIALEDTYNKFDITPLLFETKHFNYGDKPTFKTHKKGIKAYWTAPNSYVPKSRNYTTELTMEFEGLGVRPEALLSELKTGRLDSLASLIADGREAIELALYEKIYTILAQAYNDTANKDNYKATNALAQADFDAAINYVRNKVGGAPVIIVYFDLCTKLERKCSERTALQGSLRNVSWMPYRLSARYSESRNSAVHRSYQQVVCCRS